jgi:secretion/DNA translocation related TadE-like protein
VSERDERGAVVVVALGLVAVLVFVAAVCVGTVAIVLSHRRAQTAADLAALAAAQALQSGGDACAAATGIAERHHVAVTRCVVDGMTVVVAVADRLPRALGGHQVPARARAGPLLVGDAGQE